MQKLSIEISDEFLVTMTGAVTKVAEGIFSREIFEY
jgi:diaminopimelate epimerase